MSATSNPPSSSRAGKKSAVIGLTCPERARSSIASFSRRTPYARASFAGLRSSVEPGEAEAGDDVGADEIRLRPARELEDAAADGEDPALLVADDEAGGRRRVVVVLQLEQEAEAALVACDGLVVEALLAVDVDRALLAVRADEEGH